MLLLDENSLFLEMSSEKLGLCAECKDFTTFGFSKFIKVFKYHVLLRRGCL